MVPLEEVVEMVVPIAGMAAAHGAAWLTRSLMKQLVARGWGINKTAEALAIRGAAMLAAQGINQFAAAAQMIEKGTGQPVRYRFDADGRPVYSYGEAASAPAPISPPLGPQSTLQGMSAAGQVPSDMVNPTWPTIYPTPYS